MDFLRFFEIFRDFFGKMLRRERKWQKFLPKSEISADPIFLHSETKYHISDSFLESLAVVRKNNFLVFLKITVWFGLFFIFLEFNHILGGESWQKIRLSSYKNKCLTIKSPYCHQKSFLCGFRTFFFDIKRNKFRIFHFSKIWNRHDIPVLSQNDW